MVTLIKKYGVHCMLIVLLVGGFYSFFDGQAAKGRLSVKDGEYNALATEYQRFKGEKDVEIELLQKSIVSLEAEKNYYIKEADCSSLKIVTMKATITDLEESSKELTDVNDKLYNANLRIQEYKKVISEQDKRYVAAKKAIIALEQEKNAALMMAKNYYELLEKERQLHLMSQEAYAEYRKSVGKRNFKITIKSIGEKVLYAAAGYGLGRLTD